MGQVFLPIILRILLPYLVYRLSLTVHSIIVALPLALTPSRYPSFTAPQQHKALQIQSRSFPPSPFPLLPDQYKKKIVHAARKQQRRSVPAKPTKPNVANPKLNHMKRQ